jgi:hypothetical protein
VSVPPERRSGQDLASSTRLGDSRSDAALRSEPAIRPGTPLNVGALLELQRTAGNQAVARLMQKPRTGPAATQMLLRLPIEGVDPSSDRFWDDLALAAETQLRTWLDDAFGPAIDQFVTDLLSSGESGAVEGFTLDTFIALIGFLPEGGEIAVGVFSLAKGVYDLLPLDSPIELAEFSARMRRNKEKLGARSKITTKGKNSSVRSMKRSGAKTSPRPTWLPVKRRRPSSPRPSPVCRHSTSSGGH